MAGWQYECHPELVHIRSLPEIKGVFRAYMHCTVALSCERLLNTDDGNPIR